jgi:hypothetical protein
MNSQDEPSEYPEIPESTENLDTSDDPADPDIVKNQHGLPCYVGQETKGLQPDGTFLLELSGSIKFGKTNITDLKFREARGKDFRAFPMELGSLNFGQLLDFASRISAAGDGGPWLPTTDRMLDNLKGGDVLRVVAVASSFFAGDPAAIGKTL